MANEVSISVSLAISKLGATNILSRSYTRDLAEANQLSDVQTIGTTPELLSIVDLRIPKIWAEQSVRKFAVTAIKYAKI